MGIKLDWNQRPQWGHDCLPNYDQAVIDIQYNNYLFAGIIIHSRIVEFYVIEIAKRDAYDIC